MKLVIVIKGIRYMRMFAPIAVAMMQRNEGTKITIVSPDSENFANVDSLFPYEFQALVAPKFISTKIIRRLRPLLTYIYWLLMDVQSDVILENKSEKFILASLGNFRKIIKPQYIRFMTRAIIAIKANHIIARIGLRLFRLLESLIPTDRNILSHMESLAPDAVLVTPAIHWRSYEMDYARASLQMMRSGRMRLLVVIRKKGYFRFVKPILDELNFGVEIILLSTDVDELFAPGESPPYRILKPIKHARWQKALFANRKTAHSVGWQTALLRERLRGAACYLYWALLDALKPPALNRLGRWVVRSNTLRSILSWSANLAAGLGNNQKAAAWLLSAFRRLEKATVDRLILDQVSTIAPDMLLSIPGIYPHTWDIDYVKAGRELGIPTIIQVASWDHLSGKGWLSVVPDRLFVWNQDQAKMARRYHAVPAESIEVIGSPSFDWLFDGAYLQSRAAFCRQAGIDPSRPFILWAESAPGNCFNEPGVVMKLIAEMKIFPALSGCQVLIRPHPNNHNTDWIVVEDPDTHVWSRPAFPTADEQKRGLYNSLAHAAAIIGLSTSVFLEAGVLDRPVGLIKNLETVNGSAFNQSMHFEKLLQNKFPAATENEAECARWLAKIVQGRDNGRDARRKFISQFLRPQGIDQSSAQAAAETIRKLLYS